VGSAGSLKQCKRCGRARPSDTFSRDPSRKDVCRDCLRAAKPRYQLSKPTLQRLLAAGERWCPRCFTIQPLENFSGQSYCRACQADYQREKRAR
jgi:hypothetical protein